MENVEELKRLGNELFSKDQFVEAAKEYSSAIALARDQVEHDDDVRLTMIKCLTNRAQCYARMGRRDLSLVDYEAALCAFRGNDDPTLLAKSHYNAGFNYAELGLHAKAVESYTKSLTFKPSDRKKVELQLQASEGKLLESASDDHFVAGSPGPASSSNLAPPSPSSAIKTISISFSGNSPPSQNASKNEEDVPAPPPPAMHPVVNSLSTMTLQSSPLKSELAADSGVNGQGATTKALFYDGDGIIVSNSNSLDVDDAVDAEAAPGVRPSQAKQKHDIDKLLQQSGASNAEKQIDPNAVWFLLEKRWWDSWRAYVDAPPAASPERKSYASAAIKALAVPPAIDNWKITTFAIDESSCDEDKVTNRALRQNCRYSTCSLHLKPGLKVGVDFVLLPRDAWEALRTWYGGGPPLPRLTLPSSSFSISPESSTAVAEATAASDSSKDDATGLSGETKNDSSFPYLAKQGAANSLEQQLDLYPASPPSVAEATGGGGLGSLRSPGNSTGQLFAGTDSSPGGIAGMEDMVFNDCGKSVRSSKAGDDKTGDSCFVCRKYSCSTCRRCKAVHYCGEVCQTAHWKYHKAWCAQAAEHSHLPMSEFQKVVPVGRRGKVGLHNLGNSCYLNSSLQCLSHIKRLTTHFLTDRYKEDLNRENWQGTKGVLVEEIASIMKDLWFRQDASISPMSFKKLLGRLKPEWAGFGQQDSQEVLNYFLDMMHEDLNRSKVKPYVEQKDGDGINDARIAAEMWDALKARDDSLVRDLFGCMSRSCVTCLNCNKTSTSFVVETSHMLAIPRSTRRVFRIYLIPWRGNAAVGEASTLSGVLELAIEVDRLSSFYGIKRALARRLMQVRPKLLSAATELLLCEWDKKLRQVVRIFSHEWDEEPVARLKGEGLTLAAFILPADLYEAYGAGSPPVTITTLQQRVFPVDPNTGKTSGVEVANFPVLFPLSSGTSCWKLRNMVWKHISAFVRPDSNLGRLLNGSDKLQRATLEMALASTLPIRMVTLDREGLSPMFSPGGINTVEQVEAVIAADYANESARRLAAIGLNIYGDLDPSNCKILGSTLPADKQVEATGLLRRGSLSMDWSGAWLEQLNVDALMHRGAVRDESAVQASEVVAAAAAEAPAGVGAEIGARRRSFSSSETPLSVEQCLRIHTSEEVMDEAETWNCPECSKKPEGVPQGLKSRKRITLMSGLLPEVLVLMLKRFEHRDLSAMLGRPRGGISHQEKIETFVDFPIEGLDIAPFCDVTQAKRTIYDLFAVTNHYGRMGFGHYTAFARDCLLDGTLSDAWHFFDDDSVRPCDAEDVKTPAAYVLFYLRRP